MGNNAFLGRGQTDFLIGREHVDSESTWSFCVKRERLHKTLKINEEFTVLGFVPVSQLLISTYKSA